MVASPWQTVVAELAENQGGDDDVVFVLAVNKERKRTHRGGCLWSWLWGCRVRGGAIGVRRHRLGCGTQWCCGRERERKGGRP